jgi:molecular chaperone GrpE (heat shock protein)
LVEEVKGAGEKNTVNKVVQAGWEVEGKVIRKPKVVLNV